MGPQHPPRCPPPLHKVRGGSYSQPPSRVHHSCLCNFECTCPAPQPPAPLPPATAPRPPSAAPIVSSDALTTHEARPQPRPQQRWFFKPSLLFTALFLHRPPRASALSAAVFHLLTHSSLACVPTAVRWCPPVPCVPLPPPQTPTACYPATSPAHYKVRTPTPSPTYPLSSAPPHPPTFSVNSPGAAVDGPSGGGDRGGRACRVRPTATPATQGRLGHRVGARRGRQGASMSSFILSLLPSSLHLVLLARHHCHAAAISLLLTVSCFSDAGRECAPGGAAVLAASGRAEGGGPPSRPPTAQPQAGAGPMAEQARGTSARARGLLDPRDQHRQCALLQVHNQSSSSDSLSGMWAGSIRTRACAGTMARPP